MNIADTYLTDRPLWQQRTWARLAIGMLISTLLVAAVLVAVRFEADPELPLELELRLLAPESEPEPEALLASEPEPISPEQVDEPPKPLEAEVESAIAAEEQAPPRDWYARIDEVAKTTVAERQTPASVNPNFDAKRRHAAVQFAPSRAPRKTPIWENVEVDQMGRKILVSGDCHRVVDDTSAANYEIFRTFQQYMVYCTKRKSGTTEQPWVDDVRERYDYLAQQDAGSDPGTADWTARLR